MSYAKLQFGKCCPQCENIVDLTSYEWNRCTCCGYPEIIDDDDEDLDDEFWDDDDE